MRLGSWAVATNKISIQPGTSGILKQQDPDGILALITDLCSNRSSRGRQTVALNQTFVFELAGFSRPKPPSDAPLLLILLILLLLLLSAQRVRHGELQVTDRSPPLQDAYWSNWNYWTYWEHSGAGWWVGCALRVRMAAVCVSISLFTL